MTDMTITTLHAQPIRPVRRIRPKPAPLLLLPEWRVDAPAPAPVTMADARAGRARAHAAKAAHKAEAFQPVEAILINPDFRARVEAIAARRGATVVCARPVAAPMPLAAG